MTEPDETAGGSDHSYEATPELRMSAFEEPVEIAEIADRAPVVERELHASTSGSSVTFSGTFGAVGSAAPVFERGARRAERRAS